MEIKLSNAVKQIYGNSSLEAVYYEAVANAIDAGADEIKIQISMKNFQSVETLQISISDNGEGFIDENLARFKKLLDNEDPQHKGAGRLVYLRYFHNVGIDSRFEQTQRQFSFSENTDIKEVDSEWKGKKNETTLVFHSYNLDRINSYVYVRPADIKKYLMRQFLPIFNEKKNKGDNLTINISLTVEEPNDLYNFSTDSKILSTGDLPLLKQREITTDQLGIFKKNVLYYSVRQDITPDPLIITAASVDGRAMPVHILNNASFPLGYEMIFLFTSDDLIGQSNIQRDSLTLSQSDEKALLKIMGDTIAEILSTELPEISKKNEQEKDALQEIYPHLTGYFDTPPIGIMNRDLTLKAAQDKFFIAQKEILEADHLTDEQYSKSLDIAARVLMEYILYRMKTIDKLRSMDRSNSEMEIHSLIIPTRKEFANTTFHDDLYVNNAWLLDDRYMSYTTILSDRRMEDLYKHLRIESEEKGSDDKRPDIAIIFSEDPASDDNKVDVVIVELKKIQANLAEKENVESQLRQRARKLLKYYPNKIQRIWFYGIVDFTDEYIQSLKEQGYIELFGKGKILYNEIKIDVHRDGSLMVPAGIFIQSYNTFLDDAEHRNETFLKIMKERMKVKE